MSHPAPHRPVSGSCENCATELQGEYCHQCGQRAHNPLRSFWHSVEDVFESFWHLDGRVFRTLRDLLIPGRIIAAYLGGHRVPYLPPLRLFVILSVLTFFIAQFAIHVSPGSSDGSRFAQDTTIAEVEQRRAAELAELEQLRLQLEQDEATRAGLPGVLAGEAAVRAAAERRIRELQGLPASGQAAEAEALTAPDWFTIDGKPWDAATNPVRLTWLPGFANDWLNRKIAQGNRNLPHYSQEPEAFVHAVLHSVPTALFVLVPVFALLLKLFYLRSGRGYLEHMVVALYSHAFLCVALLAIFALQIVGQRLPAGFDGVLGGLQSLLWIWMAVYLWWTQYRVYAQGWAKTTLKYVLLGSLYFWMVMLASVALLLASLVKG